MANTKATICTILLTAILFGGASIAEDIEHDYARKDCTVIQEDDGIVKVENQCGDICEKNKKFL